MIKNRRPLTIALPKKGRLSVHFNGLFDAAGYVLEKNSPRQDFATARRQDRFPKEPPFQALLQKADDALANLQEGFVDAVIAGRDKYEEINAYQVLQNQPFKGYIAACFNFSSCRMVVAARPAQSYQTPSDLKGRKIATSYPATLKKWLQQNGLGANDVGIMARSGGIEDYVRLGAADAICDLVESGRSLHENNLVPYFDVYESQALLIVNLDTSYGPEIKRFQSRLQKAAAELYPLKTEPQEEIRHKRESAFAGFDLAKTYSPL